METPWADNGFFEGELLPDGGWNCEAEHGATVSSFGTTINVVEACSSTSGQPAR